MGIGVEGDQTGRGGPLPVIVMDTTKFLCDLMVEDEKTDPYRQCHRPIVVKKEETYLDSVLGDFVVEAEHSRDHVVDRDIVLYWTPENKRIITGADIFGRLLKGIARRVPVTGGPPHKSES